MAGRRAGAGLALAALCLTAAGCGLGGGTKTVTTTSVRTLTTTTTRTVTKQSPAATSPCTGSQLTGSFAEVSGSAGAGQIEYRLTLKNTSQSHCYVFGLPQAQLLSAAGSALPTHVAAEQAGSTGKPVVLAPGASAVAQARFSASVAGPGDSQSGACQPQASTLRVTPDGGGVVDAAVKPPTSVCERGTLYFETFAAAT